MGQGANVLFNLVSIIFLALTLIVGLVVVGVASDSMDSPVFAPKDTQAPPTFVPTAAPSSTPGGPADLTPSPEPDVTPLPGS